MIGFGIPETGTFNSLYKEEVGAPPGLLQPDALRQQPITPADVLPKLQGSSDTPLTRLRASMPQIEGIHGFKDTFIQAMSPKDLESIQSLLAADPRLDGFADVFADAPEITSPFERAAFIEAGVANGLKALSGNYPLSTSGNTAFAQFIKFYHGYLAPFPDKTETEDATSLFELAASRENAAEGVNRWDVSVNYDKFGNILAAASGQLIPGGTLWNEHTWRMQHNSMRGSRAGTNAFTQFEQDMVQRGAQRVMIEVDNPFALADAPEAHDMSNPALRRRFWAEEGQSMDPYDRFRFWGQKQGFSMLVALVSRTDPVTGETVIVPEAANNSQIPLPGNEEGCRTICSMVKPSTDAERRESESLGGQARDFLTSQSRAGARLLGINPADIVGGMPMNTFINTYSGMQATIADDYAQAAEYKDAMSDMARAETILVRVDPLSPTGLAALKNRADNEANRPDSGKKKLTDEVRTVVLDHSQLTPDNPLIPKALGVLARIGGDDINTFDETIALVMNTKVHQDIDSLVKNGGDASAKLDELTSKLQQFKLDESQWKAATGDSRDWRWESVDAMAGALQNLKAELSGMPAEQQTQVMQQYLQNMNRFMNYFFLQTKGDEVTGLVSANMSPKTGNVLSGWAATARGGGAKVGDFNAYARQTLDIEARRCGLDGVGFVATEWDNPKTFDPTTYDPMNPPKDLPADIKIQLRLRRMSWGLTMLPVNYTQPESIGCAELPMSLFVMDPQGRDSMSREDVMGLCSDIWSNFYQVDPEYLARLQGRLQSSMPKSEYALL